MKINLNLSYWKQLREIKAAQINRNFIPTVFISVAEDGALVTGAGINAERFETMQDIQTTLITVPGISSKTQLFIEDFRLVPDGYYDPNGLFVNGLYLPSEPLLYYSNKEERKRFIDHNEDFPRWMSLYLEFIHGLMSRSMSDPTIGEFLVDLKSPALNDLMENHSRFSLEELVERYQDRRWFVSYEPSR